MLTPPPDRQPGDGLFPFGALNGPRPVRAPASGFARQLIIGTYPSALHVGWQPPEYVDVPPGAKGRIASLAVDVEPTVFWDGEDAEDRIARWKADVGFVEGDYPGAHGRLFGATNGPSGAGLRDHYFPALPYALEDTAFMDVYPVYFVKKGTQSRRGQADAIAQEYDAVVGKLSGAADSHPRFVRSTLPLRPTAAQLPPMAHQRFGHWLVEAVLALAPDHIVTLGEEVWQTMAFAGLIAHANGLALTHTRYNGAYGQPGSLVIGGTAFEWTALAHPGAVRQSSNEEESWGAVHARWLAESSRR